MSAARVAQGGGRGWPDEVARYYDRNTRRFLLVGAGRGVHAMHRELWGPQVESASRAADHVNTLVADEIARLVGARAPVVVDFGCGVGGTLFHLARRFPRARASGITVSARQVEIARRLSVELGLRDRCSFALGDFQATDLGVLADVGLAIESFVHSDRPGAFLQNAARHLRPGGHLIFVDDFLAVGAPVMDARQRLLVEQFRMGWRVPAVCTVDDLVEAAAEHGLEPAKKLDLTPMTRPGSRKRDRVIAAMSPLLARFGLARIPFYGNMIGGNALQIGLRERFLLYQLVVLRKTA